MKKIRFILIALIFISVSSYFQPAGAQEKTKEEQEKELRLQKAIDEQKKAMVEQQKAQEEIQKAAEIQQKAVEKAMQEVNDKMGDVNRYNDAMRNFRGNGNRSFYNGEPFFFTPGVEAFYDHGFGGDGERTTWDFSKSVKESSFSKEYSFDVEKTVNTVVMSLMGDCKSGEIRVVIVMPNGKTYSDITIDEFGNLNWRKSFTISEEENQDKAGEWVFKIISKKATGNFKISLQTY
jgi:predicted XRE-type DNA-binding protein